MNNMRIFSIGKIENNEKMVCINLDEKYAKGLRGLDGYSHVQVLWWADGCDNESSRNVLVEEKPYKNGPNGLGAFLYGFSSTKTFLLDSLSQPSAHQRTCT